jgi:hypothetical protein
MTEWVRTELICREIVHTSDGIEADFEVARRR